MSLCGTTEYSNWKTFEAIIFELISKTTQPITQIISYCNKQFLYLPQREVNQISTIAIVERQKFPAHQRKPQTHHQRPTVSLRKGRINMLSKRNRFRDRDAESGDEIGISSLEL